MSPWVCAGRHPYSPTYVLARGWHWMSSLIIFWSIYLTSWSRVSYLNPQLSYSGRHARYLALEISSLRAECWNIARLPLPPRIYLVAENLNSDPHDLTASTLPAEPASLSLCLTCWKGFVQHHWHWLQILVNEDRVLIFWDSVLCSSGWPWIYYIGEACFELLILLPPRAWIRL